MSITTKRSARKSVWFWGFLALTLYVMLSVGIAVSTADTCDGHLGSEKTWSYLPPHWSCPRPFGG